jgi:hypothetical protein
MSQYRRELLAFLSQLSLFEVQFKQGPFEVLEAEDEPIHDDHVIAQFHQFLYGGQSRSCFSGFIQGLQQFNEGFEAFVVGLEYS